MDLKPASFEKIQQLMEKGVSIPNPGTLDIGEDVVVDQISGEGVVIYPGCRIYGGKTVISAHCRLGYEAPLTLENCQLGQAVDLRGGFAARSVFLEKSGIGMGAHVREGCLLEEEANGAHCVGLKQTILFPFVTLGSLINFCDCFMGGGTSRANHSEVGSSYIHFNFTPDADKSTPSLIGDVPRGVMLGEPPIFLGGQGGMVGPLRIGFGNVVAAGSILRRDYPQDGQLISDPPREKLARKFIPAAYPGFQRIIENNILYLANLRALEAWYTQVRKPFLDAAEFGPLIYAGILEVIALAVKERLNRLRIMAVRAASQTQSKRKAHERQALAGAIDDVENILQDKKETAATKKDREAFLRDFRPVGAGVRGSYIETIQTLPPGVAAKGTQWLQGLVDCYCQRIASVISSPKLFSNV